MYVICAVRVKLLYMYVYCTNGFNNLALPSFADLSTLQKCTYGQALVGRVGAIEILIFDDMMDAEGYVEILRTGVLPFNYLWVTDWWRPSTSSSLVCGLTSLRKYSFSLCHRFLIGLQSGLSGGVFHQFTLSLSIKSRANLDVCFGSLPCIEFWKGVDIEKCTFAIWGKCYLRSSNSMVGLWATE